VFADAILRNSERLSRLVSDLLDLSRIESGEFSIEPRSLDLGAAVGRAVGGVEAVMTAKGQALATGAIGVHRVVADPDALDQVLVNLLDNAARYTPEAGHVEVRARRVGAAVRIEVADDGPGVPEKYRNRVFQRFYRVDKGRSREQGGTGLGLAIVKHLVESMGGEVGVEAAEPHGAVFWFTLPAVR